MKTKQFGLSLLILPFLLLFFQSPSLAFSGPAVTILTPADNALGVAPADHVYITFDRDVFKGSGNIYLRKASDQSIVWTTPLSSPVDIKISGETVEILLPFQGNGSYYVEIPNTAFRDASNNYFEGFSSDSQWNFTTISDSEPPVILSMSPASMSTGIATNSSLSLTFNEPIQTVSGHIMVKQLSDDATVVDIDLYNPSAHLQKTGTSITISAPLKPNTSYYVIIPSSGISDLYGNYFPGFTSSSGWNFATSSEQIPLPSVITLLPADNASGVASADHVYITFDRNVFKGSGDIYLRKESDQSIVWTTPLSSPMDVKLSDATAEILLPFGGNGSYYVEIPNTAFKDKDNNYFEGFSTNSQWNFATISDTIPPGILSMSPASMSTDIATNTLINLTFNESIRTGSGHILIKQLSDHATVLEIDLYNPNAHLQKTTTSISISAPLEPSTSYYVIIPSSGISDLYGNYFPGFTSSSGWTFTTSNVESARPSVVTLTPADNASDVTPDDHVYITFDREVFKGSGDIYLRYRFDHSIIWSTPLSSPMDVKLSGTTAEILLPFRGNGSYYVEIPNTAFRDASNNYFEGLSTDSLWNFTTISDTTPPGIVSISPVSRSAGVATNTYMNLNFDERIQMGSGHIMVKQTSDEATVVDIDLSNPYAHLQRTATSITISAPLKPNTSYYVIIPSNGISDLYGNYFPGFTSSSDWSFMTSSVGNPAPTVVSLTPARNATGVTPGEHVYITFDRDVLKESGELHLRKKADQSIVSTTPLSSSVDVRISGATVEIVLPMEKNEQYYLEVPVTAFRDADNNYFAGIHAMNGWNFSMIFDEPVITSFLPKQASAGTTVHITGTNLNYASTVTFGGKPVTSFIINSPTIITATVGEGASGDVSVTTPGGTATQSGFVFVDVVTNIEDKGNDHGVSIFPNPSEGGILFFQFDASWENAPVSISLHDLHGRTIVRDDLAVLGTPILKWNLDKAIADGLYVISISSGPQRSVKRIWICKQ